MSPQLEEYTLIKFERSQIRIGVHGYILAKLISERVDRVLGERRAVFYASRAEDEMEAVVKLRFQ